VISFFQWANPFFGGFPFHFDDICIEHELASGCNHGDLHFLERRKNMNKGDLVNEVSKIVKTKKDAQAAVDCVLLSITKALENGDSVSLIGFGTFKVTERKARKGRNPQTGEEIDIAASKVPKFVAGKALKEAVK
jgi:DNA-binding protein HU-beta